MAKFVFELEDVLKFRKFEEQQAQGELAKSLALETEINNKLEQIAKQYAILKNQMKGLTDFSDIISQSQFNNLLKYQKEELLQELTKAKLVSEEKRKILQEVMKKTTALNKLKDKQYEEYLRNENKAEEDFSDEISNGKHFHQ